MEKLNLKKYLIFFLLCMIIGICPIVSCAEQINIEQINFELGVNSLEQQDYKQAVKYFELVLQKNPKNVEARYNLALAFKKMGYAEKSVTEFDKVVKLLNNPENYKSKGIDIEKLRQENRILHDNELAADKYALYSKVKSQENDYVDLGDMHYDNQEFETAIEYYNLALQINPYNDFTYYKVAKTYIERNDYIKAEPYITRAIQLNPQNPKYTYYKDEVAKNIDAKYLKNIDMREKVLNNALYQKDPMKGFDIPEEYKKELFKGEPETAYKDVPEPFVEKAESVAEKPKADSEAKKNETAPNKLKMLFGKKTEKTTDSTKKIIVDEKTPEVSQGKNPYFAQGRSQELDYLDLGDLHYDNQEFETALEYYNLALKINSGNDYTYYKIARCYLDLKSYNNAESYIDKALALSAGNKKYTYFKNEIAAGLENAVNQRLANENEFKNYYYPKDTIKPDIKLKNGLQMIPEEPKVSYEWGDEEESPTNKNKTQKKFIKSEKTENQKVSSIKPADKKPKKKRNKNKAAEQEISSVEETTPSIYGKDIGYYQVYEPEKPDVKTKFPDYIYEKPMGNEPEKTANQQYTPDYFNTKGIEYFKLDNLPKAENFFKKAIELKPMYAKAYNNLANVEVRRGNLDNAVLYDLKAIEIDPSYPEPYYNLAMIYKKKKDFTNEISYLNQAIQADPKFYKAYFARGLSYYTAGNYEQAKYNFKETLKLKNDDYLASQNLGIIYANELNKEEAVNYLQKAIRLNKNNPASYYYLASIYQASGDTMDAMENYQKTIELDPVNYKAYLALSKTYEQNDEIDRAIDTIKDAISINQLNAEPYNYLGLLQLKKDKYIEATKSFQKAVELNSKRAVYHYNLSQSYICLNMKKRAKDSFERAVSIAPVTIQDYIDLSEIFLDRKMPSYSIKVLRDGIMAIKDNDYLYVVLAKFYEKTGATSSAQKVLQDYLVKKPNGTLSLLVQKKLNNLGNNSTNNTLKYNYDY